MSIFQRVMRSILTSVCGATLIATVVLAAQSKAARCETVRHVPQVSQTVSGPPAISAKLVDADRKAKERSATVEVDVSGLAVTDPGATTPAVPGEAPRSAQGHIHYRLDNGPVIATTTNKLSFHGLTRGKHKITVSLAGNDHQKIGEDQTLWVTVP